jgi:hypothetical protein
MPELLSNRYCTVSLDSARGILRFTRTEQPYASLVDVADVHERVGRIFDRAGRDRNTLLVDMRRAPLNSDPAFEKAAGRGRKVLVRGFGRVAVLVQTAVGALQVKRHLREDGIPGDVFTDEGTAVQFLCRNEQEPVPTSGVPTSGVAQVADGPFKNLSRHAGRR